MPVYDHKRPRGEELEPRRLRLRRFAGLGLLLAALTSVGAIWSSQPSQTLLGLTDPDTSESDTWESAEGSGPDGSEVEVEPEAETEVESGVIEGRIGRQQVFADALVQHGVTRDQVFDLVRALRSGIHRSEFNPDVVQSGDLYSLVVDSMGAVESFEYVKRGSLENRFLARRDGNGRLKAWKESYPLEKQIVVVAGKIDDSLWNALAKSGETPGELSTKMTEIFEYDVDFMVDCRSGDRFTFAVEKLTRDGAFVRYGEVLAAEYSSARLSHRAFLYEALDGDAAYYDDGGKSLRGLFLKSPLNYRRISSGFNRKRFHPILKKYIPHHGIDYAADYGTPVWATADGTILSIGRKGALGNYVEIKHKNGYKTGYGHLSRFGRGLKVGSRIRQKQIVGYVGATGRATGPHLHYNFIVDEGGRRKYVDAATVVSRSTGKPVPITRRDHFQNHRNSLMALLAQATGSEATASLDVTHQYRAVFQSAFAGITE